MTNQLSRYLLAASAVILVLGGVLHAAAFRKAVTAVTASNLPAFYANALKGLWLIDSATLITLTAVFSLMAARPAVAAGSVIAPLALIPAATAVLLYVFVGSFMPAHMLLASAGLAAFAGLLLARG